ncbi:SDR family oxidoreductase [Sphingomonas hengshuiensis]|uniref:Gluconate 5-dehydrogenase n=1 Tax=Sphingomonas hengshuiensis TaxID=1609977 RepID=A0A7U4LE90_9SPHN|nr:SDR family oxidoreductase [Sphingomonas hengshuiensis]AJP71229.1 gluconate 5-dehydrogenase [Sphingomonas hengshuiensis]
MTTTSLKTLFDLTGRTALITGGSRGLGLTMAEALGEFGAKIIVTARKQAELDDAVAHLRTLGIEATAIAADVGKQEEAARIVETVKAAGGRIDILVNNAGTSWGSKTEEMPLDGWNKLMAVNLTGPFLMAQAIAREFMIPAGWGKIINIASVEGLLGHHPRMVGTIAYNASKGGLINFTRALAAEWGGLGITVNALAPGYFPSKLTGYVIDKHGDQLRDDTPRGQLGTDDDLKGAVLLLASDAGAHITGQVLAVDGGASII